MKRALAASFSLCVSGGLSTAKVPECLSKRDAANPSVCRQAAAGARLWLSWSFLRAQNGMSSPSLGSSVPLPSSGPSGTNVGPGDFSSPGVQQVSPDASSLKYGTSLDGVERPELSLLAAAAVARMPGFALRLSLFPVVTEGTAYSRCRRTSQVAVGVGSSVRGLLGAAASTGVPGGNFRHRLYRRSASSRLAVTAEFMVDQQAQFWFVLSRTRSLILAQAFLMLMASPEYPRCPRPGFRRYFAVTSVAGVRRGFAGVSPSSARAGPSRATALAGDS